MYEYAINSLLFFIFPFLLAIILGALFRIPIDALIIISPYVILRSFCGGFHMKSKVSCIIMSSFLLTIILLIKKTLYLPIVYYLILSFSIISLIIISPVNSKFRNTDINKYKVKAKVSSIISIILCFLINIIVYAFNFDAGQCITLGIFLTAILQLPCLIKHNHTAN